MLILLSLSSLPEPVWHLGSSILFSQKSSMQNSLYLYEERDGKVEDSTPLLHDAILGRQGL
jgi:hypothetical protein